MLFLAMAFQKRLTYVIGLTHTIALVSVISLQPGEASAQIYDPLNDNEPDAVNKTLVLPGRIQQGEWMPAKGADRPKPLRSVGPAPHWFNEPPVFGTNIPAGAAFPVTLTSPVIASQLRPGDTLEFETLYPVTSGDGRWIIPEGSLVHAQVSLLAPMMSTSRKGRLGISFYEIVTADGLVVPFTGDLLAYPGLNKEKAYKKANMAAMLNRQMMTSHEGVMVIPLKGKASKQMFPPEKTFSVRVGRAIYYGATVAYQEHKPAPDNIPDKPDKGVVLVRHFSSKAQQDLSQYQSDPIDSNAQQTERLMIIPLDGFIGDGPMP